MGCFSSRSVPQAQSEVQPSTLLEDPPFFFTVSLSRPEPSAALGIMFSDDAYSPYEELVVQRLLPKGLLRKWNEEQVAAGKRQNAVRPGDIVVQASKGQDSNTRISTEIATLKMFCPIS